MKPLFILAIIPVLMQLVPNVFASKSINSDDMMENDIPPDGERLFCDHPSNPRGCYDRNDNPEEFCIQYPEYTDFCNLVSTTKIELGNV
jgi:hypothetical protein